MKLFNYQASMLTLNTVFDQKGMSLFNISLYNTDLDITSCHVVAPKIRHPGIGIQCWNHNLMYKSTCRMCQSSVSQLIYVLSVPVLNEKM